MGIGLLLLKYEDPVRQEAARKTVPLERLEEKALVSLAKVRASLLYHMENLPSDSYDNGMKKEYFMSS